MRSRTRSGPDFQGFLRDRSLAWNLAYCEGFESTGLISSEFFLQEIDDFLADADAAVHELWAWHLAEEFEHRNVAHDVLAALYPGYLRRLRGFRYCGRHLYGFSDRVRAHMLAIDRERGRIENAAAASVDERAFEVRERRFGLPRLLRVLAPGYSPHARPLQGPTRRWLARYEA